MNRLFACASIILAAATVAVAEPQFIVLPGQPTAMSADGSIVVGGNAGTFRWVRTGSTATYTIINPNTAGLGAVAVSSDGSVMIGSIPNTNELFGPAGYSVAARWTAGAGYIEQHAPEIFTGFGTPNAINVPRNATRDGRFIVGFGYLSATQYRPMVLDTQTGTGVNPGGISASGAARILCVSDDASVLGGDDDITGSAQRPAIWRFNVVTGRYVGTILEPGTGGAGSSTVNVISADGSKASGQSYFDNNKLVRWEYNPVTNAYAKVILATALTPAGATLTRVVSTAMTPDGDTIFGTYNGSRAFIWTAATGMVDLTTALTNEGITGLPAGAVIGNVSAVSANGRVFAGAGGLGGTSYAIYRDGGVGCVAPLSLPASSTAQVSACTRTIIINATASGTGPFTYQHRKNGEPIVPGPTGNVDVNGVASTYSVSTFAPSQLFVNNAGPLDAGTYDVIITSACGSVTTEPRVVTALAPETNDTCATAAEANGTGTMTFTMCGAYQNESPATCATTQRADVWIRYTALNAGDYRITNCSQSFDTILSVYDSCGGAETACNNTFCSSAASIERITLAEGQAIYIRLGAGSAVPGAPVVLSFEALPPPPANDLCQNAEVIAAPGAVIWDNTYALTDGAASCNANSGKDVWYAYTAPAPGTITVDTCTSLLNTVLSAYDSCGGTQLACNDNANVTGCTFQSAINNLAVARNQTVLLRVAANTASGAGSGFINLAFTATPCTADINGDGFVDPDDLSDYIACFFAAPPCPQADFNGDTFVDPDDLSDYIALFFSNPC